MSRKENHALALRDQVLTVAQEAMRQAMAVFVTGDLATGQATVSTSTTSSSIVIVDRRARDGRAA
jgi:hypothetical protein